MARRNRRRRPRRVGRGGRRSRRADHHDDPEALSRWFQSPVGAGALAVRLGNSRPPACRNRRRDDALGAGPVVARRRPAGARVGRRVRPVLDVADVGGGALREMVEERRNVLHSTRSDTRAGCFALALAPLREDGQSAPGRSPYPTPWGARRSATWPRSPRKRGVSAKRWGWCSQRISSRTHPTPRSRRSSGASSPTRCGARRARVAFRPRWAIDEDPSVAPVVGRARRGGRGKHAQDAPPETLRDRRGRMARARAAHLSRGAPRSGRGGDPAKSSSPRCKRSSRCEGNRRATSFSPDGPRAASPLTARGCVRWTRRGPGGATLPPPPGSRRGCASPASVRGKRPPTGSRRRRAAPAILRVGLRGSAR